MLETADGCPHGTGQHSPSHLSKQKLAQNLLIRLDFLGVFLTFTTQFFQYIFQTLKLTW